MSGPALHAAVVVERRDLTVDVDVTVPAGTALALYGPSGAGKSTVLAAIAGLVPLRSGAVRLGGGVLATGAGARRRRGTGLPLRDRGVGLLAQRPGLFPHLDAGANIGYALAGGRRDPRVAELAAALDLTDLLDARPGRLSGGQCQRVALARVLAAAPRVLLLDEPFSGLDPELRSRVGSLVAEEAARRQVPALMVTHDLVDAQRWAQRVAVLDRGRCLQLDDPVAVVHAPLTTRVATLVGYRAFVPVRHVDGAPVDGGAQCGPGSVPPGAATLGVHPDRLVLGEGMAPGAPAGGSSGMPEGSASAGAVAEAPHGAEPRAPRGPATLWLQATVAAVRAVGAALAADVELPGGATVPVPIGPGRPAPTPGERCRVGVVDAPWFDAAGGLLGAADRSGGEHRQHA